MTMSATNQPAGPLQTDNFTVVFNAAKSVYQRVTGSLLDVHAFAAQIVSRGHFKRSPSAGSGFH